MSRLKENNSVSLAPRGNLKLLPPPSSPGLKTKRKTAYTFSFCCCLQFNFSSCRKPAFILRTLFSSKRETVITSGFRCKLKARRYTPGPKSHFPTSLRYL
ncbi:hypothetical protein CEXT_674331 [Caerostris extrusa]|uniref:Uncharacterized protein n=1 Tax=Caerostris extrusa TaxID=172846 RepID=A0AAV4VPI4_CAEEX|nr:hypothetical protein CEXT_674331 [Caerostris extrusa]